MNAQRDAVWSGALVPSCKCVPVVLREAAGALVCERCASPVVARRASEPPPAAEARS